VLMCLDNKIILLCPQRKEIMRLLSFIVLFFIHYFCTWELLRKLLIDFHEGCFEIVTLDYVNLTVPKLASSALLPYQFLLPRAESKLLRRFR